MMQVTKRQTLLVFEAVCLAQRDTLDLSGVRAFLNRELAEDSLAALLADNAAITTASTCTFHSSCYVKFVVSMQPHYSALHAAALSSRHSRAIKSNRECGCCLQIKLSTKSFEPAAAEVLAQGIANVRGSLIYADLSDIIAGAGSAL